MRTLRPRITAEFLQWFGLGGAALVWTGQHLIGYGVTLARCGAGGAAFGIDLHTWEIATLATAATLVLCSEAAAVTILVRTWGTEYGGAPPDARRHFFAFAAAIANVLFLVAMLLDGIASLTFPPCRQG
jgi:hypothetical protein